MYVALDDSKRKLVVAMLQPGATKPDEREIPKDATHITRLFRRLEREGPEQACYEAGVAGYAPLPPDHGVWGHVPGDRAGPDAAPPRAAHQDRSPRCPETGPPVAGRGADADPRARRGGGSGPGPGASRGRAARCGALAASAAEVSCGSALAGNPRISVAMGASPTHAS